MASIHFTADQVAKYARNIERYQRYFQCIQKQATEIQDIKETYEGRKLPPHIRTQLSEKLRAITQSLSQNASRIIEITRLPENSAKIEELYQSINSLKRELEASEEVSYRPDIDETLAKFACFQF